MVYRLPQGGVASTPAEASEIVSGLGGRGVIKAQVHAGGRGKGGGIVVVDTPQEAARAATSLLEARLVTPQTGPQGVPVAKVLVEEVAEVTRELYLGLTIDRAFHGPVMIASEAGGMDIEEIAVQPTGADTQGADRPTHRLPTLSGTKTVPHPGP